VHFIFNEVRLFRLFVRICAIISYIFVEHIVTCIWGVCDYRRGMNWILDVLTTCVHYSEIHFAVY
jgi:hypothetical protein